MINTNDDRCLYRSTTRRTEECILNEKREKCRHNFFYLNLYGTAHSRSKPATTEPVSQSTLQQAEATKPNQFKFSCAAFVFLASMLLQCSSVFFFFFFSSLFIIWFSLVVFRSVWFVVFPHLGLGAQLHFVQSDHSSSSWNAADLPFCCLCHTRTNTETLAQAHSHWHKWQNRIILIFACICWLRHYERIYSIKCMNTIFI